jgi:hypothetical protein
MARETLILRDSNGTYYELDAAVLVAARVPEHRAAELEQVFDPEVSGHGLIPTPGLPRFVGAILPPPGPQHFDFGGHVDIPHVDHG